MKGLLAGASAIAVGACAQAPTQELDIAAERVEIARSADAALFAPIALEQATVALYDAQRLTEEKVYLSAIHAAGRAVAHADEAFAVATTQGRIVQQKVERSLMELEGLLSIAESRGAAGEELVGHQARYNTIKGKAEAGDLLTALAEAEAFMPELLAFEQRFRN